jgi:hypothetical protein
VPHSISSPNWLLARLSAYLTNAFPDLGDGRVAQPFGFRPLGREIELLPGQSALAPPAQYSIPAAPHLVVKAIQAWPVASAARSRHRARAAGCRDSDAALEPDAAPQLRLHLLHLPTDSLALGPPLDHKAPVSAPSAVVSKSEKGKRPRAPCVARRISLPAKSGENATGTLGSESIFEGGRWVAIPRNAVTEGYDAGAAAPQLSSFNSDRDISRLTCP